MGQVAAGVGAGDVAGPGRGLDDLDGTVDDPVEGVDQLAHGGARAGAQVDHVGLQPVEAFERRDVGGGQVPDVNVVADARAVDGRPAGAGDPERDAVVVRLDQLAQGVARAAQLQARAHLGVGADRVEVTQGQDPDRRAGRDVGEHALADGLGARVGALRVERGLLGDRVVVARAVDRGRGAEDHAGAAVADQVVDELQALGDVGAVVSDGVGHGIGDHDERRAMDDGLDIGIFGKYPVNQRAVADLPLVEHPALGELPPPRHETVEDDGLDPGVEARRRDRTADISRPAGYQNAHP